MSFGRCIKLVGLTLAIACALAGTASAALPTATTGGVRSVTGTSATLTGTVNPQNEPTTYYFQYGLTTAYGSQTPTAGPTAANKKNLPVTAGVSGLSPGKTYHYRLVAINGSGTRLGRDRTFTTAGSISLLAGPGIVTFGAPTLLSGQLAVASPGNVKVTLQENPYPFAGFKNVATTQTDGAGRYAFNRAPTVNSRYQVTAATRPQTVSVVRSVLVRVKVSLSISDRTPAVGQRVVFAGRVRPAHNGRFVIIQRRVRGAWRAVRRSTLIATRDPAVSRYRTTLVIRSSGLYRAHVGHDADHAPGSTSGRRLTVH